VRERNSPAVPQLRVYETSIKPVTFRSPTRGDIRLLRVLLEGPWVGAPDESRDQLALLVRSQLAEDLGHSLLYQAVDLKEREE
jgi:hypothetical protein